MNTSQITQDYGVWFCPGALWLAVITTMLCSCDRAEPKSSDRATSAPTRQVTTAAKPERPKPIGAQDGLPRFMYIGEVIHVGGEGSRTVTKNAYNGPNARNTEAYLDARRLVFVSFNRGGDLAWIGCAKGFTVTKCTSSTGNEVEIDQDMGCMLMFNTKMKSVATVNCVRRE